MPNLMDSTQFVSQGIPNASPQNVFDVVRQAKQNPRAFEEMVMRMNPQGYQRALQIRNSQNPKALVMEMARAQGIPPDIFHMLGIR